MTNEEAPTEHFPPGRSADRGVLASGQKVFSRYMLEAQVGRGGMGVVWRARDEKLDRPVALKFLPPEVAADAEAVRDLKLETRRCLDLTHVNIVRVYDFVEDETGAAIAMEYVEGESLAKLKATAPGGCLAADDLTPLVAQLCAALRYAHQVAKVVHHDLKPANVLVTRDGILKVTDFGIARSLTETQTRVTGKLATSGTLHYMSPQQLAGEKPTAADDIYALGALLYELLTGKPPFFRGDAASLRQQVMERPPAALDTHRRDAGFTGHEIPPQWSATILACLAKKPGDRPAGPDEVARRLGVPLEPAPTSRLTGLFAPTPGRAEGEATAALPRRRSLVPWLMGMGAVLVGVAATWIYFGVYVPEQARLAAEQERAHKAELALRDERARQAEEKRREAEERRKAAEEQALAQKQKDEAMRAQMEKDQGSYLVIIAKIAALTDSSPAPAVNEARRAVSTYLRTAPDPYHDRVENAWNERLAAYNAAQAASRPGSFVVETDPPAATVVLYPRNERKTSPALFDAVKPGDVTLHVEKEGFEPKDIPLLVKPGVQNKVPRIQLVATNGTVEITSDPSDLYLLIEGNGRRLEGRTPFSPSLPPGEYKVTYQRRGWRPQVKTVTIERGKTVKLFGNLKGFDVELRSRPLGAQITVDRQPIGVSPVTILDVEPRDYQVTATLEGYDVLTKIISVKKTESVVLPLTESALPRALRRLAGGQRWHYESLGSSAELVFTAQGKISGLHHSGLGAQVRDVGVADSFNASTNTITAHFTAPAGKLYYVGPVQIKIVDDDHIAVSWTANGSAERLVLERDKGGKKKKP
jgi:hypothetical protein